MQENKEAPVKEQGVQGTLKDWKPNKLMLMYLDALRSETKDIVRDIDGNIETADQIYKQIEDKTLKIS